MKKLMLIILVFLLSLTACTAAPTISVTTIPPATESPSAAQSVLQSVMPSFSPIFQISASPSILPSDKASVLPTEEGNNNDFERDDPKGWLPGDVDHWGYLPMSIPVISDDDLKIFNPDKVADYFVVSGCGHEYSILKEDVIDGKLFLTITDDRYSNDINDDYQYLKNTYSLSDKVILGLPIFSGCVIYKGYMYASQRTLKDRESYGSYEDWQDNSESGGAPNSFYIGELTLPLIPVSDEARLSLINCYGYNKNLTCEQLKYDIINGGFYSKPEQGNNYLRYISFDYQDGEIIGIYQDNGDV